MHGSLAGAASLADAVRDAIDGFDRADIVLCPPYPFLALVAQRMAGSAVQLGAQDVCEKPGQGAFTGEVSSQMLAEVGCRFAIVGHSERRQFFDDSDARVAAKFIAAQGGGARVCAPSGVALPRAVRCCPSLATVVQSVRPHRASQTSLLEVDNV